MRICIVGGGAIGCVAARYLADKGHSITLVEQDNKLCNRTSGGNASILCFDSSISIFRERIDLKSIWITATQHPKWAFNYVLNIPKEKEIYEKQRKLLQRSSEVFHEMVLSQKDYVYGKIVKYSDGTIKNNSFQSYTPDLINRLVVHPNINLKLSTFVKNVYTKDNKVEYIETSSGEKISADVFVLCKNMNEGPILIIPVYGQTLVRELYDHSNDTLSVIDSKSHVCNNFIDGRLRVSYGALVRSSKEDAVKDLFIPELKEDWNEILTNPRPVTPDSLPVICKDRKITNLFYSGGHGFIGWSLSFVSAELLNNLITGKPSEYNDWVTDRFI